MNPGGKLTLPPTNAQYLAGGSSGKRQSYSTEGYTYNVPLINNPRTIIAAPPTIEEVVVGCSSRVKPCILSDRLEGTSEYRADLGIEYCSKLCVGRVDVTHVLPLIKDQRLAGYRFNVEIAAYYRETIGVGLGKIGWEWGINRGVGKIQEPETALFHDNVGAIITLPTLLQQ